MNRDEILTVITQIYCELVTSTYTASEIASYMVHVLQRHGVSREVAVKAVREFFLN